VDFVDKEHPRNNGSATFLAPLDYFGINLVANFLSNLARDACKEC
jgi:hypothetical protein